MSEPQRFSRIKWKCGLWIEETEIPREMPKIWSLSKWDVVCQELRDVNSQQKPLYFGVRSLGLDFMSTANAAQPLSSGASSAPGLDTQTCQQALRAVACAVMAWAWGKQRAGVSPRR